MTADFSWRDLSAAELHVGGPLRHPAGKRIPESPEVRAHRQDVEAVDAANGDAWPEPAAPAFSLADVDWPRLGLHVAHLVFTVLVLWVLLVGALLAAEGLGGWPL